MVGGGGLEWGMGLEWDECGAGQTAKTFETDSWLHASNLKAHLSA